jgi:hypothetical protein
MEMAQTKTVFAECDKQSEPIPPSSLTLEKSSTSITLTWTDNQTNAVTGYKVRRKAENTDNFTTVSTIEDNTTRTYENTDVESGTYWYRVRAYNSIGDGKGSEVKKIEFP